MEENEKNGGNDGLFRYRYSAPNENERREIEAIRSQYASDRTDGKFAYVKKLDARVRRIPVVLSLITGITGLLVFGGGLALCLEYSSSAGLMAAGVLLSAAGVAVMVAAKFVHGFARKTLKEKYGGTIVKLTGELLGEDDAVGKG